MMTMTRPRSRSTWSRRAEPWGAGAAVEPVRGIRYSPDEGSGRSTVLMSHPLGLVVLVVESSAPVCEREAIPPMTGRPDFLLGRRGDLAACRCPGVRHLPAAAFWCRATSGVGGAQVRVV